MNNRKRIICIMCKGKSPRRKRCEFCGGRGWLALVRRFTATNGRGGTISKAH